jgi:hypothetical protein
MYEPLVEYSTATDYIISDAIFPSKVHYHTNIHNPCPRLKIIFPHFTKINLLISTFSTFQNSFHFQPFHIISTFQKKKFNFLFNHFIFQNSFSHPFEKPMDKAHFHNPFEFPASFPKLSSILMKSCLTCSQLRMCR